MTNKQRCIKFAEFAGVMFSVEETPRSPSESSSSHLKNNVFGLSCGSSGRKLDRRKPKREISATFLVRLKPYAETINYSIIRNFFSSRVSNCAPKCPFLGMESLENN